MLFGLTACGTRDDDAAIQDGGRIRTPEAAPPVAADAGVSATDAALVESDVVEPDAVLKLLPAAGDPAPFLLSATGLYRDIRQKRLHPRANAFTPMFPLWSDGSDKQRWVIVPEGTSINVRDPEHWVFPIGTLAFKEFRVGGQRLETRLVARTGPGQEDYWMGSFVWNEDEGDAVFSPTGASNVRGTTHDVPKAQNCGACHRGAPARFLGLSTVQQPSVPAALLTPAGAPTFTAPGNEAEAAALGYLHANCAHCHNPGGSARPDTDLDLRLRTSDREPSETLLYATTINVPLQYFLAPKNARRVIARDLVNSALVVRMRERGDRTQMPALATEMVDAEGVALVEAWISQLD